MKFFYFILFHFLGNIVFSQNIAVENSKAMNIIYPWRNSITIVVENIPCTKLYIKTNNGRIEGTDCNFFIIPESIGRATIFIHQINGSDTLLLGEKKFKVKRFPLSKPYLGARNSGLISLPELKAQLGIQVHIDKFDIDARVKVEKFRISFIRKNELFAQIENEGTRFSDKVKEKFNSLQSMDQVLIDKVMVRSPGIKGFLEVESSAFIIE